MMVLLWWVTYPEKWWKVVSLLWVTYPKIECDLPDKKTWPAKSWQDKADKRRFLIAGWLEDSLMTGLISSFLWDSPISRVHLILFSFQDLNRFFVIINSMILSLSTILLDFIEDLFLQQIKNICNASMLDDMHASLPDLKYRPPSSMFHHHRVPLFVIQSFLYSFNVLAHSCASLPLRCKFSAYRVLSVMITVLVVYQAWVCPQVWCCLIHHEWA